MYDDLFFTDQVATLPLMIRHYEYVTSLPESVASSHMGGIYSSFYSLGSSVGPSLGGFILQWTSYGLCCTIFGVMLLLSMLFMLIIHYKTRNFLNPWFMNKKHFDLN